MLKSTIKTTLVAQSNSVTHSCRYFTNK